MKNLLLLTAIICGLAVNGQGTEKVFKATNFAYYGIDFTNVKVIGVGDESPHKIRDEYFKPWNSAALEMDVAKTFQKQTVFKDLLYVTKANAERETDALVSDKEEEMSAETIADMVKKIPIGNKKDGLGVVIIAESFNKTTETATVHVVFFDIATHNVLWSKVVTGKTGKGDTLKAFAAAIKDIFTKIEKKEFDAWRKEAKY